MTESEWYASEEHFNTEMSYQEYLKTQKGGLKTPSFDELMKM